MPLSSINPADGRTLAEYPELDAAAETAAIAKAHDAFLAWRRTGFPHRAALMLEAAAILRRAVTRRITRR